MSVWKKCPPSALEHKGPALFLDRDGVVIVDRNYLSDPNQVELLPGSAEAMIAASAAGYLLIGVSNQSGLGRGRFSIDDLELVMARIDWLLGKAGTGFDGFYFCPHAPGQGCDCRKPAAGLFEEAAESCRWATRGSWVVGDKASDVAFGRNRGLGSVLVRTGYGAEHENEVRRQWGHDPRVLIADDLAAAYAAIRVVDREDADL
ncbi:MAG: HAD family hydrolase [Candidatus Krumholzibacteria bacterium]|nr:HAD family hydrolase [Candidatus Krumholzibacteria bacterium]